MGRIFKISPNKVILANDKCAAKNYSEVERRDENKFGTNKSYKN